jgi:glycosyltransferase involved in cell wall biosynthesis
MPMKLIIYLPALNEAENIQQVIARLPKALGNIDSIQYLVINDGSTDNTGELASSAGAHVISHEKNRGVGAAFHSAVHFALENNADILVGIDADGQFDPAEIPGLIAPIVDDKADMVIGNRFVLGQPKHMSLVKYWGNKQVSNILTFVSGQKFQDVSCGFRAFDREALLHLNLFGAFTYTHETILSLTYQEQRILEHPIKVIYHSNRKSRVAASIYRYAIQTSKIIFRVMLDYRPMRVFGTMAGVLGSIGIGFVLYLLGHYIVVGAFTPYKSLGFIGLGFFIFGALVFLIALIADMLNRLRTNQDKILYEIKKLRYNK